MVVLLLEVVVVGGVVFVVVALVVVVVVVVVLGEGKRFLLRYAQKLITNTQKHFIEATDSRRLNSDDSLIFEGL